MALDFQRMTLRVTKFVFILLYNAMGTGHRTKYTICYNDYKLMLTIIVLLSEKNTPGPFAF